MLAAGDEATQPRWLIDRKAHLSYPFACRSKLNMIEPGWRQLKYLRRRFISCTEETIDAELAELLYG